MNKEDVKIEAWPQKEGGMQTGQLAAGVKVLHLPTGLCTICTEHRHQHKNRAEALCELENKVDAYYSRIDVDMLNLLMSIKADRSSLEMSQCLLIGTNDKLGHTPCVFGGAINALNDVIVSLDVAIGYLTDEVDA